MVEQCGFVGVGVMGSRMGKHVLQAGYPLMVYDIDQQARARMVAMGATEAASAREVGERCTVVLSSLPTVESVREAYLGPGGILEGMKPGTLCIELSTITPQTSREIAHYAEQKGAMLLDAPVIGPPEDAEAGRLTIVVGGEKHAFERAKPILQPLARKLFHVGVLGNGNAIKLVNITMAYANFAAAAEAFALGAKLGVDAATLHDIIAGGGADSRILSVKMPKAIRQEFRLGHSVYGVRKDLKYALEIAYEADVSLPLTALTQELYGIACARGEGSKDFSVLAKVLQDMALGQSR